MSGLGILLAVVAVGLLTSMLVDAFKIEKAVVKKRKAKKVVKKAVKGKK